MVQRYTKSPELPSNSGLMIYNDADNYPFETLENEQKQR